MEEEIIKQFIQELSKYGEQYKLGRVLAVHKSGYEIESDNEIFKGQVTGRFHYVAYQKSDYPIVGDYVIFLPNNGLGIIEKVCDRYSKIDRLGVSTTGESQVLATNIDLVFICMSLNEDFRLKKLQNFIGMASGKNYETIILLTKSDLCEDVDFYIDEVKTINQRDEIVIINQDDEEVIDDLFNRLENKTGVFIGSSGVGKSTLINKLLKKEHFKTKEVLRTDDQGRHTTSHRELVYLENGGAIIDTPGIRIVYSYIVDDFDDAYSIVMDHAKDCKFNDCKHEDEPGCNVQKAIEIGDIPEYVFESYLKTERLNKYNRKRERQRERMLDKRKRG